MRVLLTLAEPGPRACDRWRGALPTSAPDGPPAGKYDRHEAIVGLLPGESSLQAFDRLRQRLFAYDIFPPTLVHAVVCPSGKVERDAIVVQQIGLGPMRMESAVRVVDVWDESVDDEHDAGFRYVTLDGHPERGVASFRVRCEKSGQVRLVLDARSEAGSLITRLGRPVARGIQLAITRAAVRRLSTARLELR